MPGVAGFVSRLLGAITSMQRPELPLYQYHGRHVKFLSQPWLPARTKQGILGTMMLFTVILLFLWMTPMKPQYLVSSTDPDVQYCGHPIDRIVTEAQQQFDVVKSRQPQSLAAAVTEYKRRYKIPPPPHFDKWYEFAVEHGTVLVDEYDAIHHTLLPFWALEPSTIRARTRQDLGQENKLIGISIREGNTTNLVGEGQGGFQSNAIQSMVAPFVHLLPDMDLAFNVHDEPRVVVPHDELEQMVSLGRETQSRFQSHKNLVDGFSQTPEELKEEISETPRSRFHDIGMQETWLWGRLSCPLDSPARQFDGAVPDNPNILANSALGLISNHTAFSDICQSPSLQYRLGFFGKPNSCKLSPQLTPVFSMSKLSSFQDILYPSPWYYTDQVFFEEEKSIDWNSQVRQMYWRGSTSGGYSNKGTWRDQMRQHVLSELKQLKPDETQLALSRQHRKLGQCMIPPQDRWVLQEKPANSSNIFNVEFTEVKQCNTHDCNEQSVYFDDKQQDQQSDAWKYRYLLDMDGNAYSGRFYAFLESYGIPLKLSFFREWHADILFPWIHYVPLSLKTAGYSEILRFFEEDETQGHTIAKGIAEAGRQWAHAALRHEDMEVYMFRLLLE